MLCYFNISTNKINSSNVFWVQLHPKFSGHKQILHKFGVRCFLEQFPTHLNLLERGLYHLYFCADFRTQNTQCPTSSVCSIPRLSPATALKFPNFYLKPMNHSLSWVICSSNTAFLDWLLSCSCGKIPERDPNMFLSYHYYYFFFGIIISEVSVH